MEAIEVKNVSRVYLGGRGDPFTALEGVFFAWRAGESVAVMGVKGNKKLHKKGEEKMYRRGVRDWCDQTECC
jgi:hypothetical protein